MVVAPNFVLGILHYLHQQRSMQKKEEAMMASCFAERQKPSDGIVDLQALQASNAQMMLLRNRKSCASAQRHACDRTIKIL
jgi:hypothetical protein